MGERLWSINEVALWLSVSASTVRRWVRNGKLAGKKVGSQWRFDPGLVREAFRRGMLSGANGPLIALGPVVQHRQLPEWAGPVLTRWGRFLEDQLERLRPDHVVVNDRRGAKVWWLLMPNRYTWGKNLWHSTAVALMTPTELRQNFGHREVLLFDEMMQHGREINDLKKRLEAKNVGAAVTSLVCVRRRSYSESGELLEYEAYFCEELDGPQFTERAALISRLAYLFEPPLDVDHLVVKGNFIPGIRAEELLERATKWGIPFVVWFPDKDCEFMAITLDRPQFFDTNNSDFPRGFSFGWSGPGKVRIYGNPESGPCYCSFITYPDIEAPVSEWARAGVATRRPKRGGAATGDSNLLLSNVDEEAFHRAYSTICINLAVNLFNDFVTSGAAEEIGISFDNLRDAIDVGQLRATFGPTLGSEIAKRAQEIIASAGHGKSLFSQFVRNPLSLNVRRDSASQTLEGGCDTFGCRTQLLKAIPERYSSTGEPLQPISWSGLLNRLPKFAESSIGSIFDDELDRGNIKPLNWIDHSSRNGTKVVKVWRAFCRGEFGPWFEWNRDVFGHKDLVIQRTIGLGPTVVDSFLKRTGGSQITATQFDKTFANLQHDLREGMHDLFYLGWRPYKYGPVPVVPATSASGEFMEFQRFLVERGCLSETREQHGTQIWRRYRPASDTNLPWNDFYRLRTSSVTRVHVASLVRLYATIQNECTTSRPSTTRSPVTSVFQDALVVLGAARNQEVTYKCGWFEVSDWRAKGELLFALLNGIALIRARRPSEPFLKQHLEDFATPARLLFDKIEMYRNLPYLRHQIEKLLSQGDLEVGELLLETVDSNPIFESQSEYPMENLAWACEVMRAFSSMTRQVLTPCGLDVDERTEHESVDGKGSPKDASFYLKELLTSCPELQTLADDLRVCTADSGKGLLTKEIARCLSQTFHLILNLFESQQRIPDPRPQFERNRERLQAREDLLVTLARIAIPQPYAIAIADIKNLRNLPRVADMFGVSYDEAMGSLLNWVAKIARKIGKRHKIHLGGLSGDSVVLAGGNAEKVFLGVVDLIRETTRCLDKIDYNQFALFGLLRAGIAWRDDGSDTEFQGVRPGILAHDLANQHRQALGAVNVTKVVLDHLLPEHRGRFVEGGKDCSQGKIFVRYWSPERDSA